MSELAIITAALVARLLLVPVERLCTWYSSSRWGSRIYLFLAITTGMPFALLLKPGWLEWIGLERTVGTAVILGIVILYWAGMMARALGKMK